MGDTYTKLATAAPGGGLKGGGEYKALTFAFTPTSDCPAVMFGSAKTQTRLSGFAGTYNVYDALNLQSGTAGSCDTEGECLP